MGTVERQGARVGRGSGDFRELVIERGASSYAEGSCLISMGGTRVLCTASVEEGVPGWRRGSGAGWVTAEYAMLPRATQQRTSRERGQLGGGRDLEGRHLLLHRFGRAGARRGGRPGGGRCRRAGGRGSGWFGRVVVPQPHSGRCAPGQPGGP